MRIISRLDIKNDYVIKGINLEGLRKIGNPLEIAKRYYKKGVDEFFLLDCVASLYRRNNLFDLIKECTKEIFIPLTIGGGIRSLKDIEKCLENGADRIAINSYVTENPKFLLEATRHFGSSTIVSYIEAKKIKDNYEVYKYYGREPTGIFLIDWLKIIQDYHCGEIILTSIDNDGLKTGFDIEMVEKIKNFIYTPLVISGGCGKLEHRKNLKKIYPDTNIALGSCLHDDLFDIKSI